MEVEVNSDGVEHKCMAYVSSFVIIMNAWKTKHVCFNEAKCTMKPKEPVLFTVFFSKLTCSIVPGILITNAR